MAHIVGVSDVAKRYFYVRVELDDPGPDLKVLDWEGLITDALTKGYPFEEMNSQVQICTSGDVERTVRVVDNRAPDYEPGI